MEAIKNLPTQKKIDELEAKKNFLLEKANKLRAELKETKEDHHKAIDKLNIALTFNQKLEAYVGHTGNVVIKARLFDANLAKNPISTGKVIPILVDFAEKMEELLDKMRALFDGLQSEVPPIAAENLRDILGEIPSLTGWGRETTPTEMPTKSDQPGPSEPTREEEIPTGSEYTSPPRRQVEKPAAAYREVPVNTIVKKGSKGAGGRAKPGAHGGSTSATGLNRHNTNRTGRTSTRADKRAIDTTYRFYPRAYHIRHTQASSSPFLHQRA